MDKELARQGFTVIFMMAIFMAVIIGLLAISALVMDVVMDYTSNNDAPVLVTPDPNMPGCVMVFQGDELIANSCKENTHD